jgi:uncharacterized YigZ family protein
MPAFLYHTIAESTTGIYREKGSKFLAFAYPVTTEFEIKERIGELKREFFDARHHCYAWVLGPEKALFRSFDDGEPNHSAGDPILGKIKSAGLTNILVVVVRYFGGIKLGVGGLVRAYKAAAEDALKKAVIVERMVTEILEASFEYDITSDVMRLLKEFNVKILAQNFTDRTKLQAAVPLEEKDKLESKLELMKAMGKSMEWKFTS